jgi:hypothetical protein
MAERSEELAARFERANAELAALIEGCTDAEWRALCKEEGWSFGVTAHHVAYDQDQIVRWLTTIATGQQPSPPGDELEGRAASLDARNARHANEHASCTRAETLELLRAGGAVAAAAVRALSDEQLDRASSPDRPDGRTWTAEEVVEEILIGHVEGHLASLRAAIGRPR